MDAAASCRREGPRHGCRSAACARRQEGRPHRHCARRVAQIIAAVFCFFCKRLWRLSPALLTCRRRDVSRPSTCQPSSATRAACGRCSPPAPTLRAPPPLCVAAAELSRPTPPPLVADFSASLIGRRAPLRSTPLLGEATLPSSRCCCLLGQTPRPSGATGGAHSRWRPAGATDRRSKSCWREGPTWRLQARRVLVPATLVAQRLQILLFVR